MDLEYFKQEKARAKALYRAKGLIFSSYFKRNIILSSKGFHHLQVSGGRMRDEKEQLFKFKFPSLAFEVIEQSSTIQEYRAMELPSGKKIEYFGMVAIVGENKLKIRVVIKRKEKSKPIFWSVMPYSRIKNGVQKIYEEGLDTW